MSTEYHTIKLRSGRVAGYLFAAILILVLLSTIGQFFRFVLGHPTVLGFVPEFNVEAERNVPTYFSSLLLLASSLLLTIIASWKNHTQDSFRWHWIALAVIFLFLSIDETASLHERLITPFRNWVDVGEWLYFAWVIPGSVFVIFLTGAYTRFLMHMDRRFRLLFLVSGFIYVAGALGIEAASGHHAFLHGKDNPTYMFLATIEETLEMCGIALFVYSLLEYMRCTLPDLSLRIR